MQSSEKKRKLKGTVSLLLATLFWGISFAVQSVGGKQLGAFTFNGLRLLVGALVIFFLTRVTDRFGISRKPEPPDTATAASPDTAASSTRNISTRSRTWRWA